MSNLEIVNLLRAVASAYQIKDEKKNKFKIIAYERAADALEHASSEAKDLWDDGKLTDLAGIGPSIAGHLGELFRSGSSKHFEEVLTGIPPSVFELIKLPGVGPKNGFKLATIFNINDKNPVEHLLRLAMKGKIAELEGFGEDSQKAIIAGIEEFQNKGEKRMLLPYALEQSQLVIEWLNKSPAVKEASVLGSMRRKAATVGDIDIAVASDEPETVFDHFVNYPNTKRVIERGDRSATILIPPELHVDLMVQPTNAFGSLLQHFTGSKHHNVALREYALKKDLSLSEYGIKTVAGRAQKVDKIQTFENEKDFYNFLGISYIPPELREDKGEIEAAEKSYQGKKPGLPELIELADIKADLQIHSNFDIETSHDLGVSSMEELARKADSLGYEYVAFTEHNPSQTGHSDKDIIEILKRKKETVEKLNYSLNILNLKSVKKVYNSLEIDILPDGRLPVPDAGLATLDFALVSIHSSFTQDKLKATKRVLAALNHPKVQIFAHPTGRKIQEREGADLDWEAVFAFCLKNNKWIEINADPMRLDLPDYLVHEAVKKGVKMTMGTDAHHKDHLDNMENAVFVARRGWAEAKNIVNSNKLESFEKMLQSKDSK